MLQTSHTFTFTLTLALAGTDRLCTTSFGLYIDEWVGGWMDRNRVMSCTKRYARIAATAFLAA